MPQNSRMQWLLLMGFGVLTAASPGLSANSHANIFARQDDSQPEPLRCQSDRAPDYYGLGVRLGIYFAWLTSYIANTMLPEEIPGALDTNTIFLFTLLVAMIKCSSINMLMQIDALILIHLSTGTLFGVLSIWGYRTCRYVLEGPKAIRHFGGFGTHFRLFLSLCICVYSLWFWLYGVTGSLIPMGPNGLPPAPKECEELYTFMFTKVRAAGGIRKFYIFTNVCTTIYFGFMLAVSSLAGFSRVHKMIELARNKSWADTTRLRFATGLNYIELKHIFAGLRVLNLLWMIFSALLVEFTLNFNHVTRVLGGPDDNELHLPAQLLPLLLGTFGFVRICWLKFEDWRSPEDHEPSVSSPDAQIHKRAKTLPMGLGALKMFSREMARTRMEKGGHADDEIDTMEDGLRRRFRYLVAWLPWLSLLDSFRADGAHSHDHEKNVTLPTVRQKVIDEEPREPSRSYDSERGQNARYSASTASIKRKSVE